MPNKSFIKIISTIYTMGYYLLILLERNPYTESNYFNAYFHFLRIVRYSNKCLFKTNIHDWQLFKTEWKVIPTKIVEVKYCHRSYPYVDLNKNIIK